MIRIIPLIESHIRYLSQFHDSNRPLIRLKLTSAVSHLRKFREAGLLQDAVSRVPALDLAWNDNVQFRPVGIAPNRDLKTRVAEAAAFAASLPAK